MPTPGDYTASDWTPEQWKAAWDAGAIGHNTGLPTFPPTERVNSRGDIYNPARVGAGGVNTGVRFPRGDEQPPAVTPAAYKPGDPPPPAPANENINDPTPPVTPGQYSPVPWGHPQVAAVPPVPRVREPHIRPLTDGTLTPPPDVQPPNRFWNPVAPQQPFADQINRYSHEYGIPPNLLSNLLRAESGFNPRATGPMTKYGQAGGIAQFIPATAARYHINPYDPDQGIRGAAEYLRDLYNEKGTWAGAVAAYNGSKTIDTSQYRGSPEGRALIAYATALDGGLVKAGPLVPPPQNYRPESYGQNRWTPDRPPSQWGRDTPDMFSGIGAIPHQREIPGIMKALAPLLMVGLSIFSKGAALPMLSFYGGYLKASAAKQDKDAKELKTKYQDQLKELKAKMGIELAAYGGAGGDMSELRNLAVEFGDQTLLGILDAGKDPGPLLQQRDRIFKDTSKTDLAERRFELSERHAQNTEELALAHLELAQATNDRQKKAAQEKIDKANAAREKLKKDDEDLQKLGFPAGSAGAPSSSDDEKGSDSGGGGDGEGDGEGASGGGEGGGTGEQGAATPPAAEASPAVASAAPPAATPASATAPPEAAPPAGTGGEDQVVDAQGNPIPRRGDVRPAVFTGQPLTARPAASATDQGVTISEAPKAPTPFDTMVSDVLNGKELNQLGIPKSAQLPVSAAVAQKEAQIDALPAGPDYINRLKAIDPVFGNFADDAANYRGALPTTRGQSGRAYMNRIMTAAQKINPRWSYQNFKRQEEFADQKGIVQTRLTRASTMAEAAANVAKDLKVLQDKGYTGEAIQAAMAKGEANLKGYSDFTSLYSDLKSFVQEDQTLKTGTATVTETEAQQALVAAPVVPGSPEQIRDFIAHNIDTAAAVIDAYQERWTKDADGKTRMPGRNDYADSVIAVMPYWNARTGAFDNLPEGVTLPPQLVHSIPKQAGHLDPEDHDALDWAHAHPDDPRAKQILQKLGQ